MPKRKSAATPLGVTVRLRKRAVRKDLQVVWRGLHRFNRRVVGDLPSAHFLVEARSPRGKLLGGLQGMVYYEWLFIAYFWLSHDIRRGGLGKRMIDAAERHAEDLGCHGVWLDTFSWQARPFYEKQGYRLFGSLPDYPTGHARYFMTKRLTPATTAGRRRRPAPPRKTRRA
jgi:GNAT superfamily N-acetyltransferase